MKMESPEVTVELAQATDAGEIMRFVREHWSPHHVLGTNKALMDWQHAAGDRYNIVVGRMRSEGIVGVLGFIPLSNYDGDLSDSLDTVWLTLWKIREDVARGLGLRLLLHIQAMFPQARIGTVGLNAATRGIYDALGYRTGALTRFALVRSDGPVMTLAKLPAGWKPPCAAPGSTTLSELHGANFISSTAELGLDDGEFEPFKTRGYVQRRYLEHPFYKYRTWLLSDGSCHGVLVTRLCTNEGAGALRVVDFVGDPAVLAAAGPAFERLLQVSDAEYLDFFCTGLDDELKAAGLFDAAQVPGLVLPGHFEPFERCNVELLYCLRGAGERFVICKGDADQDRPNKLPAAA